MVGLSFELMDRQGQMGSMGRMIPEVQEMLFEYLTPSALQTAAVDPNAMLVENGIPTKLCQDALWEVFHTYATQTTPDVAYPHKAMNMGDWRRYMDWKPELLTPTAQAEYDKTFNDHGLPQVGGRTLIGFNGYLEWNCKRPIERLRLCMQIMAKRFYRTSNSIQ